MNAVLLNEYSARVRCLIHASPQSNRVANYFRSNEFLQKALLDASLEMVKEPRNDAGLTRWMMENSGWDDIVLLDAMACFLILLRGWDIPSH